MNVRVIGWMGCMMLVAQAGARQRAISSDHPPVPVLVRVENTQAVPLLVWEQARIVATEILAEADIQLQWGDASATAPVASAAPMIGVRLETVLPANVQPDTLAYARPYQSGGTRIHVLLPRLPSESVRRNAVVLGHVLAHEIGHVLQGVARHSDSGIMKARWDYRDMSLMMFDSLSFESEDVRLIHSALRFRSLSPAP